MPTVLEEVRTNRDALQSNIDTLLAVPVPEDRTAAVAANAEIEAKLEERATFDTRIKQLEANEVARAADAAAAKLLGAPTGDVTPGRAQVISEPTTYGKGTGRSYFLDLARADYRGDNDARARLIEHARQLDVDLPDRAKRGVTSPFEKRVNPNRTDGQGGYFVPPVWLIDQYAAYLRAGRVTADLCTIMDLPEGTDSINLPKVLAGTTTAVQQDGGAVSSTDLTDASVTGPVRTIAGQQDIALQLLDQSPVNFDVIVLKDLAADYNQKLDVQVLYGTGSSGQMKGINAVSGINLSTYTDATPTLPELYPNLAQSLSLVAKARFLPATGFVMTPQRWYWMLAQLDGNLRPLVVPSTDNAFNPAGGSDGGAQGPVGHIIGTPVYIDANVSSTLNTNQDQIIAAKFDDLYLYEGQVRTRVLAEVLSGTLQVRVQLFNYVAAIFDRYPVAITSIGGTGATSTGLISPSGY